MRSLLALLALLAATHGGPADGGQCDGSHPLGGASTTGYAAWADNDGSSLIQRTDSLFGRTPPPDGRRSEDAPPLPEGALADGDEDRCVDLLGALAVAGDAWLTSRCGLLLGPSPPAPCLAALGALGERPWGPDALGAGCQELLRSTPARLLVRRSRRLVGDLPAVAALQNAASAASATDRSDRLAADEGQDAGQAGPLWALDASLPGKSAGVTYDGQAKEAVAPYPALNCENISFFNNTHTGVDHVAVANGTVDPECWFWEDYWSTTTTTSTTSTTTTSTTTTSTSMASNVSGASDVSNASTVSNASDASDASNASDAFNASDDSDASNAFDAFNASDDSDASNASDGS